MAINKLTLIGVLLSTAFLAPKIVLAVLKVEVGNQLGICVGERAALIATCDTYKVEVVPSPVSRTGEGPHWDAASQSLYYVDIDGTDASLLRYDYAENKVYTAIIDDEPVVSFIIPVEGTTDQFAVGIYRRVGVVRWDGKSPKATLLRIALEVESEDRYKTNRFNDAKADPYGRFFGGTERLEGCKNIVGEAEGNFYSFAKGQAVVTLKTNVSISNGLTWNEKTNKFYYIDTCAYDVKEYDYDPATGSITNERVLIDFTTNGNPPNFGPDGMTIDSDGHLYVGTWGGSRILRVDPSIGKIVQEINFPATQIPSAAFGGPNLDILYVTSAARENDGPQPLPAGKLFKVTGLGIKGLPMSKVRL